MHDLIIISHRYGHAIDKKYVIFSQICSAGDTVYFCAEYKE